MKHYVYELLDPRDNTPFYIGKGTGYRARSHFVGSGPKDNRHRTYKINKIRREGFEPYYNIIKYFDDEDAAYHYEETLIETIGLDNLTNMKVSSKGQDIGWTPSEETLQKRSRGLKGIPRSEEWCRKLSEAKSGENNPMYGRKEPCSEERRLAVLKGKNEPNKDLYTRAIIAMNEGESADSVSRRLNIGRGVCFRLKNRTHGIFTAFPELLTL